ncbi:Integrase core domain-containing protein, partial [Algoriphagus ornithinivorans]
IKNEYLKRWKIKDINELKRKVKKAVNNYNTKRLHRAFDMKYTPMGFYQKTLDLPAQERPTVNVYTEGKKNYSGASSPQVVCPREEPLAHICPMEFINEC